MKMDYRFGRDIMGRVGAIVLGGGRGTRLYPLTAMRAKPAVPLLGRYRLVDIPLSQCIHSGINRIVILTQFNSASLHRHISDSYKFDNFSKGMIQILAAEQTIESGDWFQGTADAVRKQMRHVRDLEADHYLILSGDQLYSMDYQDLLRTHLENRADITVSTLPVDAKAARGFGIMKLGANGRIKEFVEKPDTPSKLKPLATPSAYLKEHGVATKGRDYLASMGVYVFRAEVLEQILAERPDWIDFGKHVIPKSLRERKVYGHLFSGYWEDIGTVRSYYEVHMQMTSPHPPMELFAPETLIYTHPRYLPGSRFQDARIKDSIICEGSRIGKAEISNTIVGIRSVICPNTKIENSVLMGADFLEEITGMDKVVPVGIGSGCTISNAIIDKNARIGNKVVIRGSRKMPNCDHDGVAVRDGIVVVLKNAVIPDGTRIE